MTNDEILSALQAMPEFKEIAPEALQWVIDNGRCKELKNGEHLFEEDAPADYMHIVLQGKFEVFLRNRQGNKQQVGRIEAGAITGVLPYSRMKTARGNGIALEDTVVLSLHRDKFRDLEHVSPEIIQELVGVMTNRVRNFTKLQQQNDKLMALGKLSAGLAHELNNPAAAVVRSSDELIKNLRKGPENFRKVVNIDFTPEQVDTMAELVYGKIDNGYKCTLSLTDRTELEDAIADLLEDYGMEDGYDCAPVLLEAGFHLEEIEQLADVMEGQNVPTVVGWICNTLNTERIVQEIKDASKRISDLVHSIKSYSHMDRAPEKERADVHEGIRNTLTMLNHKIKRGNFELLQNFAEGLPPAEIFVSELNQVWTNLIDNALDAMPEGGKLEIATRQDREFVQIDIIDSGSGIPSDVLDQIFDPFFTTKPVGKGTGLGLDVVKRIIDHHNGSIKVESEPGRTHFEVCIPIGEA